MGTPKDIGQLIIISGTGIAWLYAYHKCKLTYCWNLTSRKNELV